MGYGPPFYWSNLIHSRNKGKCPLVAKKQLLVDTRWSRNQSLDIKGDDSAFKDEQSII